MNLKLIKGQKLEPLKTYLILCYLQEQNFKIQLLLQVNCLNKGNVLEKIEKNPMPSFLHVYPNFTAIS